MKIESSEIETISNNKKSKISENNELKEVDLETGLAVIDDENEPNIPTKKCYDKLSELPFIVYILLFTFLLFIISIIILIAILSSSKYKIYYTFEENIYLKPKISGHNYSRITFENGLEMVFCQIHYNDMAGGAISFEEGYLDKKYEPGFLRLALLSLKFNKGDNPKNFEDYMGELFQAPEEFYSTMYFTILNSGFESYLVNFKDYTSYEEDVNKFNKIINDTLNNMNSSLSSLSSVKDREKYLIEYLVYDIKDENGNDVNMQGNATEIRERLNGTYSKILYIMQGLFAPKKIKLIFYTHFKMSLMRKYVLRYLQELTRIPENNNKEEKQYENITTNKIIYHQIGDSEKNYIKINYYVKNDNETLNQLYIDSGYFNYLKYILDETNNDSLYYNLSHPEDKNGINIESLSCDFEVILKSRIRFSIYIRLNHHSYNHIKEIIEIVYEYMEKIKAHINNLKENDERIKELYFINNQNFTFTEDIHEGEFYKNKVKDLFYRDNVNYYLKEVWIPPNFYKNKSRVIYYINQLTLENSVVIIGLSNYKRKEYKIDNTDISFIFKNLKITKFSQIVYSINNLDKIISEVNSNNINNEFELPFYKNDFISNYTNDTTIVNNKNQNNGRFTLLDETNDIIKFYLLRDTSFKLPKSYICFYFFHPFLRPNFTDIKDKHYIFYHLMLYLSYIQREFNSLLSDAIRAGNSFNLGFVENYVYIDVFAYSDIIENILIIIKKILISDKTEEIFNNYYIYKDYTLEYLLKFINSDVKNVLKYEFFKYLTKSEDFPEVYNYEKFPKENFLNATVDDINKDYIQNINMPIIYSFILGYYEEKDARKLYQLYSQNFSDDHFISTLDIAKYTLGIKPEKFITNLLTRNDLNDNIEIDNYRDIKTGRKYVFMKFLEFSDYNRIAVEMLRRIIQDYNKNAIKIEVINQKYIYLRISFFKHNETKEIIDNIISTVYNSAGEMTKSLDVIGNRYYYLANNLENEYTKTPSDMKNAAFTFSYNEVYNRYGVKPFIIDTDDYNNFYDNIYNVFNENKNKYCLFWNNETNIE